MKIERKAGATTTFDAIHVAGVFELVSSYTRIEDGPTIEAGALCIKALSLPTSTLAIVLATGVWIKPSNQMLCRRVAGKSVEE